MKNKVTVVISILRRYYIIALHKFQIYQPHFLLFFWACPILFTYFFFVKQKDAVFSLFRSSTDGNYLYSFISLSLFGDDSTKKGLTILLSCVLLLHNNNYCEHPVFLTFAGKYNIPLSRAFKFSVSLSKLNFDLLCVNLWERRPLRTVYINLGDPFYVF